MYILVCIFHYHSYYSISLELWTVRKKTVFRTYSLIANLQELEISMNNLRTSDLRHSVFKTSTSSWNVYFVPSTYILYSVSCIVFIMMPIVYTRASKIIVIQTSQIILTWKWILSLIDYIVLREVYRHKTYKCNNYTYYCLILIVVLICQ